MIAHDFAYYRPDTLKEAYRIYHEQSALNRAPAYYAGGSEVITMSRAGSILPDAVIDLKAIPECTRMGFAEESLMIGACVTLSAIAESKLFPMLGTTAGRIADHTNQCRITLGGNVCGTIIYRESVLPLLLTDSSVYVYGANGERKVPIKEAFYQRAMLKKGDFISRFAIDKKWLSAPYIHVKKTKNEKIDYPLLTLVAVLEGGCVRMAFSGLCEFPFRSSGIEDILNDPDCTISEKAERITHQLPGPYLDNLDGSAEYRSFVLKNTVHKALQELGGMSNSSV